MKALLRAALLFVLLQAVDQKGLHAQIGRRILNRAKNEAEYKINRKVNEQVDKTVDKTVSEIDTLLTGKKRNPDPNEQIPGAEKNDPAKPVVTDPNQPPPPESPDSFAARMNTASTTLTILTNITCEAGKRNTEKTIGRLKGVKSLQVNIQSGDLSIVYDDTQQNYKSLIREINNLGFEADGSPATAGKKGCN